MRVGGGGEVKGEGVSVRVKKLFLTIFTLFIGQFICKST